MKRSNQRERSLVIDKKALIFFIGEYNSESLSMKCRKLEKKIQVHKIRFSVFTLFEHLRHISELNSVASISRSNFLFAISFLYLIIVSFFCIRFGLVPFADEQGDVPCILSTSRSYPASVLYYDVPKVGWYVVHGIVGTRVGIWSGSAPFHRTPTNVVTEEFVHHQ